MSFEPAKTHERARYSAGNCNAGSGIDPGERQIRRWEIVMKLPAFLFLFLSSATISSAWAGTEAPGAQGRSTYSSPSTENVMDFQSDRAAGAYGGPPIQIVVPNVGIFTGWLHGDVLEAKFSGAVAKAVYELAPEPDYLQLVKPTAPVDSNP